MDASSARALLEAARVADLVTRTADGLRASYVPLAYDPRPDPLGSLVGHVARANDQWRVPPDGEALVIVHGPDAYVSPSWYESKREHGRVVPTWNYSTVYVSGSFVVHDDPEFVESVVRRLTARHEAALPAPWSVDDAPRGFVEAQLRAVVGVEVVVTRVEAKAKWSQNRSAQDAAGVLAGLVERGAIDAAGEMRRVTGGDR